MKRRGGIVSDMTPLLDVIFIILFLVMVRNVKMSNEKLPSLRRSGSSFWRKRKWRNLKPFWKMPSSSGSAWK